ncbi:hypothetical protein KUTeg_017757, partial [Tegillarca granosa]
MDDYDLCIVGAGLIGSSAARHAVSSTKNVKVCLIGPEEAKDRSQNAARDIFGAWYDEGRITRQCDKDPVWLELAKRSINRYRDLEKESGIKFYTEVGCLSAGDINGELLSSMYKTAIENGLNVEHYNKQTLKKRFPYLNFNPSDEALFEFHRAGHVSPRKLLTAQLSVAERNGCDIINDVVKHIQRKVGRDGSYIMEVKTETGRTITARKVLLAPGAYTTSRQLLPPQIVPNQTLTPLNVSLVEITDSLCRLYYTTDQETQDWCKDFQKAADNTFGFYLLPPIKYPDGKYYLKLGCFHEHTTLRLTSADQIKDVFCETRRPSINVKSFYGDRCVITETPTERPYIDMIHSQLGVAIGGNGFAAKSSDEIGRIATMMVLKDVWDTKIARED